MALDVLIIQVPRFTWFTAHIVLRYGEEAWLLPAHVGAGPDEDTVGSGGLRWHHRSP
jgi:hypothetical protein